MVRAAVIMDQLLSYSWLLSVIGCGAVSYTHLDVYKRQVVVIIIIFPQALGPQAVVIGWTILSTFIIDIIWEGQKVTEF